MPADVEGFTNLLYWTAGVMTNKYAVLDQIKLMASQYWALHHKPLWVAVQRFRAEEMNFVALYEQIPTGSWALLGELHDLAAFQRIYRFLEYLHLVALAPTLPTVEIPVPGHGTLEQAFKRYGSPSRRKKLWDGLQTVMGPAEEDQATEQIVRVSIAHWMGPAEWDTMKADLSEFQASSAAGVTWHPRSFSVLLDGRPVAFSTYDTEGGTLYWRSFHWDRSPESLQFGIGHYCVFQLMRVARAQHLRAINLGFDANTYKHDYRTSYVRNLFQPAPTWKPL